MTVHRHATLIDQYNGGRDCHEDVAWGTQFQKVPSPITESCGTSGTDIITISKR
jgi:hypothetical protein